MRRPASPLSAVAAVVACLGLVALARTGSRDAAPADQLASAARQARPALVTATPDAGPRETPAARALREGRPLDVNLASPEDLQLLPRIGPALAGRIVASRDARGPFRSVDDLDRVRGIGRRTIERLRPMVTVRPARGDGGAVEPGSAPGASD